MWEPEKVKEKAQRDYEGAWLETAGLLRKTGRIMRWEKRRGKPHPVTELVQRMRETLLSYGFEEVVNPSIVSEDDVRRQYGPEAAVILDRVFYLAGLPRPDIGLSRRKVSEIRQVIPGLSGDQVKKLQGIFREYKEGKVEGDDFVEELVTRLGIEAERATAILGLFPELTGLTPVPSKLTLRSHMTALWFPALAALQPKRPLPIQLFSVGTKYRREQRLDETHIYESYVASLVVMADEVTLEDGAELTRAILSDLGLREAEVEVKRATSKYYAPGTEAEVWVRSGEKRVEVGDIGLYSPVSLANYGISHPVFNAGFGVERIAMLLHGAEDIRELVYPQFYAEWELTDAEIARLIHIQESPRSEVGVRIRDGIRSAAEAHADEPSPCEFLAYEGEVKGRRVRVYVYEPDAGTRLLGPAARNRIYVYDGNVLGIPERGLEHAPLVKEARRDGVPVGISYLDAVASLAAARIEEASEQGRKAVGIRVRMAKTPSDVNIAVDERARRYITGRKRRIEVTGPVFIGVRAEVSE